MLSLYYLSEQAATMNKEKANNIDLKKSNTQVYISQLSYTAPHRLRGISAPFLPCLFPAQP